MEKGVKMHARFKIGLKFYLSLFICALTVLLKILGKLEIDSVYTVCIVLAVLYVGCLKIEFNSKVLSSVFVPLAFSLFSFQTGQHMISVGTDSISVMTFFCNTVAIGLVYYLLLCIFARFKLSVTLSSVIFFILNLVNYALCLFRGRGLGASDFYSIKNAVGISGRYTLTFSPDLVFTFVLFLIFAFFLFTTDFHEKDTGARFKIRITSLSCALLCAVGLWWGVATSTNSVQPWGKNGAKLNGVVYNLLVEIRESRVEKPYGYSRERAESILARYKSNDTSKNTPHIIVIMDEAFSDLSVLGALPSGTNALPFFSTLSENTVKGYALSSVYGGNTATSEWEFLTGNTAAFLPIGAVAYQQYVKGYSGSIISSLNSLSYTTVAMHPYKSYFWDRDRVYSVMGFDEVYFEDDLSKDDRLRGFVTDKSLFGDIINRFEARGDGEKLFLFSITMQNHGDYKWEGFETRYNTSHPELNQYLELVRKTDDALYELTEYFKSTDEPVMILIFGDHQPSLNTSFYDEIFNTTEPGFEDLMKKYIVPFAIWTNYSSESETDVKTGLNSLSALLFERAGITLPPYLAFLEDMKSEIPEMNSYGYYSKASGTHVKLAEISEDAKEYLDEYRILQYYNLFDKNSRKESTLYETK